MVQSVSASNDQVAKWAVGWPIVAEGRLISNRVEIELRIDIVAATGTGQASKDPAVRPPRGLLTKSEVLRFSATRFISRLLTLLSVGTAPALFRMIFVTSLL